MANNKIRVQLDAGRYADLRVAANQKVVEIKKVLQRGYILDIKTNKVAIKELTPNAYMLYMHFMLNKIGYIEALSIKNVMDTTSLSERKYYKAVNELIQKRYLVKTDSLDFNEFYIFYEGKKPKPE